MKHNGNVKKQKHEITKMKTLTKTSDIKQVKYMDFKKITRKVNKAKVF